jgi:hypothetical protein
MLCEMSQAEITAMWRGGVVGQVCLRMSAFLTQINIGCPGKNELYARGSSASRNCLQREERLQQWNNKATYVGFSRIKILFRSSVFVVVCLDFCCCVVMGVVDTIWTDGYTAAN